MSDMAARLTEREALDVRITSLRRTIAALEQELVAAGRRRAEVDAMLPLVRAMPPPPPPAQPVRAIKFVRGSSASNRDRIRAALDGSGTMATADLVLATGLPTRDVLATLSLLVRGGLVEYPSAGKWRLPRPAGRLSGAGNLREVVREQMPPGEVAS